MSCRLEWDPQLDHHAQWGLEALAHAGQCCGSREGGIARHVSSGVLCRRSCCCDLLLLQLPPGCRSSLAGLWLCRCRWLQ